MTKIVKWWKCIECGQEVVAQENPTETFPMWSDGHKCKFIEVKKKNKRKIKNEHTKKMKKKGANGGKGI
jgi:hypothetical protein